MLDIRWFLELCAEVGLLKFGEEGMVSSGVWIEKISGRLLPLPLPLGRPSPPSWLVLPALGFDCFLCVKLLNMSELVNMKRVK
jgi:hypothetical protein